MWTMEANSEHVLTLANSIIGVSILAMPYCFKQCGILLAIIILLFGNLISRLSCYFLIKSAIIARRKTFEYLAYYIFGGFGKFMIEVGMIGFLIGTCIAFFVVMGDLGPEIISGITGQDSTSTMRSTILLALALLCVLPLALLKNVDSLTGVSKATIGFYVFLVLKIVIDAFPHIFSGDWINKVEFWRPSGVIQCLPIFSMALSCQTQLFEIYQVVHNPSLEKMNHVIKNAVNICTLVYFFVGFFGYIAFANRNFTGNILLSFTPSLLTNIIKLGFILSIAFSFPLVIFPCRASVHSLIYRQGVSVHEGTNDYIPEGRFKLLTLLIVIVSLVIGILIPNIEFVLGLVGSSIGIMICVLFPVTCFISISQKNTNERLLAKVILIIGIILMVLGTFENLHHLEKMQSSPLITNVVTEKRDIMPAEELIKTIKNSPDVSENDVKLLINQTKIETVVKVTESPEIRHEPPQPVAPQDPQGDLQVEHDVKKQQNDLPKNDLNINNIGVPTKSKEANENKVLLGKNGENIIMPLEIRENSMKLITNIQANSIQQSKHGNESLSKNDDVDIEAIKKDDKETLLQQKGEQKDIRNSHLEEHQILIDKIQKQNEVQEELVKQQKKLIEAFEKQQEQKANDEKLKAEIKAVKEIESIALKAIEKISGDAKQNEQIVAELEKDVLQKVNAKENALDNEHIHSSQDNFKIAELKHMNNLLSAKIKQNNITQKPLLYENQDNKVNKQSNILHVQAINSDINKTITNNNKTAPLLANLGQKVDNEISKNHAKNNMLPLPLAVSYLQNSNLNISNIFKNATMFKNIENLDLEKNAGAAKDVKIMRRDILAYIATRKKR